MRGALEGLDGAPRVPGRLLQMRLLQVGLQEGLVDPGQGLDLAHGARAVAPLDEDAREQPAGTPRTRVFREQVPGALQVLLGLVQPSLVEQLGAHRHLRDEVAGVGRRQPRDLLRSARPALGQRGQGFDRGQRSGEAFLEVVREGPVEALHLRSEHPVEHLLGGGARRVFAEHRHQRFGSVVARDQLAHQRCLVVGVHDLITVGWAHEAVVELAHRQDAVLVVGDQEAGIHVVAPRGRAPALLVDRESLRQPARHPVLGEREVEDVGDLVPEGRGPVELAPAARGGRVHRHHRAEAHPQRPEPREPDRAHREIRVAGEELEPDRDGRLVLVALGEGPVGLLGQRAHRPRQQFRLPPVDDDPEVLGLGNAVALEGVQKVEGVLVPRIVRIAREGPLELRAPLFDRAHPKLVDAQDAPGLPGVGIEGHRFRGEGDRVRVAAGLHRHVGHGGEQARVVRVQRPHPLPDRVEFLVAVAQEVGRRQNGERLEGRRVHLQRGARLVLGRRVVLKVQMQARQQSPRRDQVGVDLEGGARRLHGLGRAVELERQRHPQDCLRMPGVAGEHLLVRLARVGAPVGVEEELSRAQMRFRVGRIRGHRLVEGPKGVLQQVRVLHPQVAHGGAHGGELRGGRRAGPVVEVDEPVEGAHRLLAPARAQLQLREVDARRDLVVGSARHRGPEARLGLRVTAALRQHFAEHVLERDSVARAAVAGRLLRLVVSSHPGEAARQRPVDGGGGVPAAGEAAQLADGVFVLPARQRRERGLLGLRGHRRRRHGNEKGRRQDGGAEDDETTTGDPPRAPPGPSPARREPPESRGARRRPRAKRGRHHAPPPSRSRIARVVRVNSTNSSSSSASYRSASMASFRAVSAAMRSSIARRCS